MRKHPSWAVFVFVAGAAAFSGPRPCWAIDAVIQAASVQEVPQKPDDPKWQSVSAQSVPLMPQRIVTPQGGGAVASVRVKALFDSKRLALLVEWADAGSDELPSAAEAFTDACAVEFPARLDSMPSPFMGDTDHPVVIYRWSASAQRDILGGRQPRTKPRPNMAADDYPAYEKVAEVLAGEKAGNILSRRDRKSPVEFLGARGYGTLTAFQDEPARGFGEWKDGSWKVVIIRDLQGEPAMRAGLDVPIAFAVWNGEAGERDGMKSVSVWQTLAVGKAQAKRPKNPVALGRLVFDRYGCAACHGQAGKGGVKNANAQGGLVPSINRVKDGFSEGELKTVIREGRAGSPEDARGPTPPLKMTAWKTVLDESELDGLVKYLFSLMPKGEGGTPKEKGGTF